MILTIRDSCFSQSILARILLVIKSLVTGGAGFIGSHVVRELLVLGHDVTVLDDLSGGFRENLPAACRFHQGSVTDHQFLSELFTKGEFDHVFHLAAYAAEGLSHFIRRFNYENNLIGSVNLINEAIKHRVKRFVFTSSIAVYGAQKPPMTEDMTPLPEDPYGVAKFAVELDLRAAHEMFGLEYTIFRPHNVFGEYQNLGDRYRNVVGIFMNQLMQEKPLSVFGDGQQTRAFSYIGDIAPIIARSVSVPGAANQIFNIGADEECTVVQLAGEVMAAMGIRGEIRHLPARNEVVHAYSSHDKVQRTFHPPAPTPLAEGLRRMATWARAAGIQKSKAFGNIEVNEKLPSYWLEG